MIGWKGLGDILEIKKICKAHGQELALEHMVIARTY